MKFANIAGAAALGLALIVLTQQLRLADAQHQRELLGLCSNPAGEYGFLCMVQRAFGWLGWILTGLALIPLRLLDGFLLCRWLGVRLVDTCVCNEEQLRQKLNSQDDPSEILICPESTIELNSPIDISGRDLHFDCWNISRNFFSGTCTISGGNKVQLLQGSPASIFFDYIVLKDGLATNGGIASITEGSIFMYGSVMVGNKATGNGGAIYASGEEASILLNSTTVTSNEAFNGGGGGIYIENGAYLSVGGGGYDSAYVRTRFVSNAAAQNGGAIFVSSESNTTISIDDTAFTGNTAGSFGDDIFIDGPFVRCYGWPCGFGPPIFCDGMSSDNIYVEGNGSTNCIENSQEGDPTDSDCKN